MPTKARAILIQEAKTKETAICPYCGAEGPSEFISGFIYTYKLDEEGNIIY